MWIVAIVCRVVTFVTHRDITTCYAIKQCLQYRLIPDSARNYPPKQNYPSLLTTSSRRTSKNLNHPYKSQRLTPEKDSSPKNAVTPHLRKILFKLNGVGEFVLHFQSTQIVNAISRRRKDFLQAGRGESGAPFANTTTLPPSKPLPTLLTLIS